MSARALAIALVVAATGCLDALAPDVGPEQTITCEAVDSDPAVDVHFQADLQDGVFAAADIDCARCHTGDEEGVRQSGLDMTSYATLRVGGGRSGAAIVVPGDPCSSILLQKLGASPPFGARMPREGPPFLTDAQLAQVSDWILEGARDN